MPKVDKWVRLTLRMKKKEAAIVADYAREGETPGLTIRRLIRRLGKGKEVTPKPTSKEIEEVAPKKAEAPKEKKSYYPTTVGGNLKNGESRG
jgi:hypothetical protein